VVRFDSKAISAQLISARKSSCELRMIFPYFALLVMVNRRVEIFVGRISSGSIRPISGKGIKTDWKVKIYLCPSWFS